MAASLLASSSLPFRYGVRGAEGQWLRWDPSGLWGATGRQPGEQGALREASGWPSPGREERAPPHAGCGSSGPRSPCSHPALHCLAAWPRAGADLLDQVARRGPARVGENRGVGGGVSRACPAQFELRGPVSRAPAALGGVGSVQFAFGVCPGRQRPAPPSPGWQDNGLGLERWASPAPLPALLPRGPPGRAWGPSCGRGEGGLAAVGPGASPGGQLPSARRELRFCCFRRVSSESDRESHVVS